MSATPFIPWSPSDWISNTRRLTLEERSIYFELLMLIYENKGVLEANTNRLARAIGTTRAKVEKALAVLVEEGKLTVKDGMVWNEKAEKVLKDIDEKSEKSRTSAKTRWAGEKRKKLQKQGGVDANALPPHCERIANHNQISSHQESSRRPTYVVRGPSDEDDDQKSVLEADPPESELRDMLAAGGIETPTNTDLAEARRWLARGLTPERIRPVLEAVRRRAPEPPRMAAYFRTEVERLASQAPPAPVLSGQDISEQTVALVVGRIVAGKRIYGGLGTHDLAARLIKDGVLRDWEEALARGFDMDRSRLS